MARVVCNPRWRTATVVATCSSAFAVAAAREGESSGEDYCSDAPWQRLHGLLDAAAAEGSYKEAMSLGVAGLLGEIGMDWYKAHYKDCVEGLLSLVLYMSFHDTLRQKVLREFASEVAKGLNPLALRAGLHTWPLFGLLDELHLVWQDGARAEALSTEPRRPSPCGALAAAPGVVSPLFGALAATGVSPFSLLQGLPPGALVVDAGVFDGTDWSLEGVLAGARVLGFELSRRNTRLFEERFPPALAAKRPEAVATLAAVGAMPLACRRYTMLRVEPGEHAPRAAWAELFSSPAALGARAARAALRARAAAACAASPGTGHAFIVNAGLGERVKALNITSRYDYTSISDQGYLFGPKDMITEEVAITTLDSVLDRYLAPGLSIDLLKLDVEGYEMGALRGAEGLLAQGRVHYLVLEFHPGMLGTTGTDPVGLLAFLRHYCFFCHSARIDRPHAFEEFVARYTSHAAALPLQGLGAMEDLVCQNLRFRPAAASAAR